MQRNRRRSIGALAASGAALGTSAASAGPVALDAVEMSTDAFPRFLLSPTDGEPQSKGVAYLKVG
jgi:hypothetical protein